MESSWRVLPADLGLDGIAGPLCARLLTPLGEAVYITQRVGFARAALYGVRPSPLGFETWGWVVDNVPSGVGSPFPGPFDVFPD